MTAAVSGARCKKSIKTSYPTGVKVTWEPKINMGGTEICTEIGGVDTAKLQNLATSLTSCAKDVMTKAAEKLGKRLKGWKGWKWCPCMMDAAVHFGATTGWAAGASVSMTSGIVIGCNKCKFQVKPFVTSFVGATTNIAITGIGFIIGVSLQWSSFWGDAMSTAASAGPPTKVISALVGVGTTIPKLEMKFKYHSRSKEWCLHGHCARVERGITLPDGIDFTGPAFAGVEIGIAAGAGVSPVDLSSGWARTIEPR
jgi:hypothetical protein